MSGYEDREPAYGFGWVLYAGIMLMIVGSVNFLFGVAAVSNSAFYVHDANFIFSDLKTYGWIILVIGAIQFCAAFAIWAGTEWGRWVGVATAAVNAIAQLTFIAASPLLSLAVFSADILVIYALLAYGGQQLRGD
jgi:uncharacterized membrane protein (DUF2068 family)